jgi:magnesium-transporting ATPase (P-type)
MPVTVVADEIIQIQNPLIATSFEAIIDNIIDFIFKIVIVLAPLMVVIGGFLFVTAGGNSQQITQAKNLLIWTAVGFSVVLLSKGILAIINQILGVRGG